MSVGNNRYLALRRVSTYSGGNPVSSLTIDAVAGDTSVQSNSILNRTILLVARSGVVYTAVDESPTGRQYTYTMATGTISFGIAFNSNEDVYIQYR